MEIYTMYDNVKALLQEICIFFEKEFLGGQMTGDELKKRAQYLLNSSQKQIMQLGTDNGYLNMKGMKRLNQISIPLESYVECDNKSTLPEDFYSSPDDQEDEKQENQETETPSKPDETCPYLDKSLSSINPIKQGLLARREQFFGFLPVNRHYHVAIYDKWMLFYNQNGRGKVLESYCLKTCIIQDLDDDSSMFHILFSSHTFSMVAVTRKDKLQWISVIKDIVAECDKQSESEKGSPLKSLDSSENVNENVLKPERTPEIPRRSANRQHIELPPPPAYENYDKSTQSNDDQFYDLFENDPRATKYCDENIYEDPEELYKNEAFHAKSKDLQPIYDQLGDVREQVLRLQNRATRSKSPDATQRLKSVESNSANTSPQLNQRLPGRNQSIEEVKLQNSATQSKSPVVPRLKPRLKSVESNSANTPPQVHQRLPPRSQLSPSPSRQIENQPIYDQLGDVHEQVSKLQNTATQPRSPDVAPLLKERIKSIESQEKFHEIHTPQSNASQQKLEAPTYNLFKNISKPPTSTHGPPQMKPRLKSFETPSNTSENGSHKQIEELPIYDHFGDVNNKTVQKPAPENIYNQLADVEPEGKPESMAHKFMNKVRSNSRTSSSFGQETNKKVRRSLFRNKK